MGDERGPLAPKPPRPPQRGARSMTTNYRPVEMSTRPMRPDPGGRCAASEVSGPLGHLATGTQHSTNQTRCVTGISHEWKQQTETKNNIPNNSRRKWFVASKKCFINTDKVNQNGCEELNNIDSFPARITVAVVVSEIIFTTILVCWGYIKKTFCSGNRVVFSVGFTIKVTLSLTLSVVTPSEWQWKIITTGICIKSYSRNLRPSADCFLSINLREKNRSFLAMVWLRHSMWYFVNVVPQLHSRTSVNNYTRKFTSWLAPVSCKSSRSSRRWFWSTKRGYRFQSYSGIVVQRKLELFIFRVQHVVGYRSGTPAKQCTHSPEPNITKVNQTQSLKLLFLSGSHLHPWT